MSPELEAGLGKARVIHRQTLNPKTKEKLYSWYAPEVECIAKGKAHKKYEFGVKASYATTNKSNFIVGAMALNGKPYDGHTLKGVLAQIAALTGVKPQEVQVDLGYRGHGIKDADTEIILAQRYAGRQNQRHIHGHRIQLQENPEKDLLATASNPALPLLPMEISAPKWPFLGLTI